MCLGFFFLLRASEFLPLGYIPFSRQLKGRQVLLFSEGEQCDLRTLGKADEVRIQLSGSKTNYNLETNRNHYKTGETVCPVLAVARLFQKYPNRYLCGVEADEPLFRSPEGWDIPREAVQMLLRRAAEACGVAGHLGSHSLSTLGRLQRCICGQALRAVGIRRLPHLFVGGPRVFPRHVGIHDQDQPHAHVAVPVHTVLVHLPAEACFTPGPCGSHSSCTVAREGCEPGGQRPFQCRRAQKVRSCC